MNARVMTNSMVQDKLSGRDNDTDQMVTTFSRPVFSLMFTIFIIFLFGVGGWRLMDPSTLPITHVRVEGNFQHLSTEKMQTLVSRVIRGGFFNLNVMSIKEVLLSEPWVHWAVVQRVWPDSLNVHVVEQTATAHWNTHDLLNASAQIFTPENAESITSLPRLSGPVDSQALVFERYLELEQALTPKNIKIQSLNLSERRAWRIQLQDGPLIILGRNDVDIRIRRFTSSVLGSLRDELSNVKQIDLRYTNGFAIQWLGDSQQSIESGLENNG